jgi:hypothetical protein
VTARLLTAIVVAALLGACGGESEDSAADAREGDVVRIDGLGYRAVLFRELNPRVPPDRSLVPRPPAGPDEGVYAAFIRVCNESGEQRRPTGDIVLEDAFGQVFRALESGVNERLTYQSRELAPGRCIPVEDSSASQTFNGAALVFEVPFDALQERPIVLEIRPRGGGEHRRIQLDL